ncbi:MAG: hypothetical protein E7261_02620 [Lachnospiraceae bacterium]|nr:hypothetical protein [Lachnospiraceae bacterium]
MKAKLGISVGLLGAATYLMALFGGYTPLLLLVGYILIIEENIWLKKAAIKAVALYMFFALISSVIGLIPSLVYLIDDLMNIFEESFTLYPVTRTITFLQSVISLARTVLLLGLGITALNQGTIKFPFVDKLIDKHYKMD